MSLAFSKLEPKISHKNNLNNIVNTTILWVMIPDLKNSIALGGHHYPNEKLLLNAFL